MKRGISFFVFVALPFCSAIAQKAIPRNDGNLTISAGMSIPLGKQTESGVGSLLANMKSAPSLGLQYTHRVWRGIFFGATANKVEFSGWNNGTDRLYRGTKVAITSIGPVIGIRTNHKLIRGTTKFGWFGSVVPGINKIRTLTTVESTINDTEPITPLVIESTLFGLGFNAGLDYAIAPSLAVSFSAGYQAIPTKSRIYRESKFTLVNFRVGLVYRIFKDRNYKYSGL